MEQSSYKSHVLIVEDDPTSINVLETLLRREGYDVSVAFNGLQALEVAHKVLPDLVISDVMMPKMDGFSLCQHLRADEKLATVPIILLTALDDRRSRLQGLELGADDFISKPLHLIELRARIRTIIKLNRYRHLLSERSKFEWVVEQSDDAYLLLDTDSQVTYANHRARQYLSLEKDFKSGLRFPKDVCTHYHCEPQQAWKHWPEQQKDTTYYLLQAETEKTPAFWLQVDLHELPMHEGFLIRLKNVSEQINLAQHVYTFQLMVSHKLRTPLAAFSAISILKQQLQGKVSKEINQLLNIVYNNGQRLQQQLLDILDYISAPSLLTQAGGYPLQKLPELIETLKNTLACQIHLEIPEELERLSLHISELALRNVMENVLGNAKKFHPEKQPLIHISVKRTKEKMLKFQIKDDGQHLPPEELERVWQPYYQSEKNITGEVGGMGIGLSTVATLIWGAGGQVSMQNRTDTQGVVVTISLPIC